MVHRLTDWRTARGGILLMLLAAGQLLWSLSYAQRFLRHLVFSSEQEPLELNRSILDL